jgi:hypothetical protein
MKPLATATNSSYLPNGSKIGIGDRVVANALAPYERIDAALLYRMERP